MNRTVAAFFAATLLLFAGACSDKQEVGSGVDTSNLNAEGQSALRDTTTTAAPTTVAAPQTTAPPQTTAKPAPTTTAAPPTTAARGPQVAITIGIYSDTSGKNQFEPRAAAVRRGQIVRFQNFDTVTRSVVESNAAFQSPDIPPGGTWDYTASTAGTFNYSDGTRPYAVGQLTVQ